MSTVTVSPKFQIVIPKDVRDSLGIEVGQKIEVFVCDGKMEVVIIEPIESLQGILKGKLKNEFIREPDRKL